MRYADPLAQAEVDRLRAERDEAVHRLGEEGTPAVLWRDRAKEAESALDRLRACSDPTPPAEGERHTAEQLWAHLLEASSHRRMYVLNQFLEAQDDALRCYMTHGLLGG